MNLVKFQDIKSFKKNQKLFNHEENMISKKNPEEGG